MKCPKGGCDYDTAADIDDAGDVSNHVKLLEVHCTYAHPPVGVQNGGGGVQGNWLRGQQGFNNLK